MAKLIFGKVYYQDIFAGTLQREPGDRHVFTYDPTYLDSSNPAIAISLPKQKSAFISEMGLHPFFDNLVAEGWLQNAQARALRVSPTDHLALLLGFGYDLPGAVSIIDPEPVEHIISEHTDIITKAAVKSFASLSGVQQKLLVVKQGDTYRPIVGKELSTHIAKLPSPTLSNLIELEYLSTLAIQKLIPEDDTVLLEIKEIPTINASALIVQRFDRTPTGKRIHFEEFNQLLEHPSGDSKYEASYEDMGYFIQKNPACITTEAYRLFKRIVASLLIGNTDAHLKNFAMFHTREGLRLTPLYDVVAAAVYKQYRTIALKLNTAENLEITSLKPKHILQMGNAFGLHNTLVVDIVQEIGKKLDTAQSAITDCRIVNSFIKEKLSKMMEGRWKHSFASIGQYLSKKQNNDENP
jgi:serine/threonine-protein kinase HipA